ncbi:MAG: HAD family hydrolase [Candidatus Thermoplasmatota archaeon]|nr:HAD family hydrolase [Euryarchaeota archaeon]MBU4031668.1 HAD family hydrolase [Candidatus Thermoplasmatota archaeon]MBU4071277.1 HAD family hydrolase [Candidatus Thermoplasmatota archaeon]MBU4144329.1 HAD family hydrolase [Candidatus Thermoplasmatota archaeon]MBU4591925.1 HAD family hydrolase [Candidatus Thermoplasmatota archaeon]
MIRAVLFDIGDTLITSLDSEEAFQLILREKGFEIDLEKIRDAHKKASTEFISKHKDMRPPDARDFNEVYTAWNDYVVKELGLKKKGLGKYINKRWFDVVGLRAYDDSAVVVNRLSVMGLRVGIVTNGYRKEVDEIFERMGGPLKISMFDVIVGRDTAGASKPDPRPFLHAAGMLGLKPDEIIFVGDRYDKDYIGSQGVGMTPVLLLRGRKLPAGVPEDVTTIQTLDELMNIIQ